LLKSILFATAIAASGIHSTSAIAASNYQCTIASHYGVGDGYHGKTTASGERFNAYGLTAAHRWKSFGTKLLVMNPSNGKSVIVRVNDRGPFHPGRDIDLSYGAFSQLTSAGAGVTKVCFMPVA
jgi:rare lipoprotein A